MKVQPAREFLYFNSRKVNLSSLYKMYSAYVQQGEFDV